MIRDGSAAYTSASLKDRAAPAIHVRVIGSKAGSVASMMERLDSTFQRLARSSRPIRSPKTDTSAMDNPFSQGGRDKLGCGILAQPVEHLGILVGFH